MIFCVIWLTCWLITSSLCSLRCVLNHSVALDDGSIKNGRATLWEENNEVLLFWGSSTKKATLLVQACMYVVRSCYSVAMLNGHHHSYLSPLLFCHSMLFYFMASCSLSKRPCTFIWTLIFLYSDFSFFIIPDSHLLNIAVAMRDSVSWAKGLGQAD